jgi:hypothetical protein
MANKDVVQIESNSCNMTDSNPNNEIDFDMDDILDDNLSQTMEFIVPEEYDGIRIDKYISQIQTELSRTYIQKLTDEHIAKIDQITKDKEKEIMEV